MTLAGTRIACAAALACAGLLTAACASQAGHSRADSQGARRLGERSGSPGPAASSGHAPPVIVHTTTPAARPPRHAGHSSSSGPAPAPAPQPSSSAPVAAPAPAPLADCSTGALKASLGPPGGTAGSVFYPLDFTNISAQPCTLYGYPGVSFVSGPGGHQLGGQAVRDPQFGPSLVTLAPGAVAHAALQVGIAQNYPTATCRPVSARWLRVYPPGQVTPLFASITATACTRRVPGGSTLGIFVVRPGANGS